jgi:hypothetical protein
MYLFKAVEGGEHPKYELVRHAEIAGMAVISISPGGFMVDLAKAKTPLVIDFSSYLLVIEDRWELYAMSGAILDQGIAGDIGPVSKIRDLIGDTFDHFQKDSKFATTVIFGSGKSLKVFHGPAILSKEEAALDDVESDLISKLIDEETLRRIY